MNQIAEHQTQSTLFFSQDSELETEQRRTEMIWRDRWIPYNAGKAAVDSMWKLLQKPKTIRPFSMLLVGDTNNGKTMIAHQFLREVEKWKSQNFPESPCEPVVYVQTPPNGSLRTFYTMILDRLSAPYAVSSTPDRRREIMFEQLSKLKTRLLIIDEIHDVGSADRDDENAFLKAVKFISNALQISVIGIGIPEAIRTINTDKQLGSRLTPIILPKWKADQEFALFLSHLARGMGIKNIDLFKRKSVIENIHYMSESAIGEARKIVGMAVEKTFESGKDKIDPKVFDDLDWTRPSDRRKLEEKIR